MGQQQVTPILWALQLLLALEGTWVIARHFNRVHFLFAVLLFAFSAVGIFSILFTSGIGTPEWTDSLAPVLLFERHIAVYSLALLVLTRAFFGSFNRRTICRNAAIYWNAVMLFFATDLICYGILRAAAGRFWINATVQFLLQGGTLGAYLLWARMTPSGEIFEHPRAQKSYEEASRAIDEISKGTHEAMERTIRWR